LTCYDTIKNFPGALYELFHHDKVTYEEEKLDAQKIRLIVIKRPLGMRRVTRYYMVGVNRILS